MKGDFLCGAFALAAVILCVFEGSARSQQLPAVSGLNGKLEFDAGALALPAPSFFARAAGTLTVPLGERFGLQADLSFSSAPGFTTAGALHAFTRDPASYLVGGTFGFVRSPGALIVAAGPEAELYLDRWTLEAWAGMDVAWPTSPAGPGRVRPFAIVGAGYYVTDNWRLSLQVSSLDNYNAFEVGSEYLLDGFGWPVSLGGELRVGQDGAVRGMLGLHGYFGPDPRKPLIGRHREDDPTDRSTALYSATDSVTLGGRLTTSSGGGPIREETGTGGSAETPPNEGSPYCALDPPPEGLC